nr:uncharacterized protein LOC127314991 [Lolium perenne]
MAPQMGAVVQEAKVAKAAGKSKKSVRCWKCADNSHAVKDCKSPIALVVVTGDAMPADVIAKLDGIQVGVPSFSSSISISAWRSAEVPYKAELEKAVGSLIGKTVDVDLVSLRRRAVVRIQVAMLQAGVLGDPSDEARPIAKADAVVKFKAFEFRFRREPADYIPEPDFVPLVWVKKDDSDEGGEGAPDGGDDAMDTSEPRVGPSASGTSQVQRGGSSSSAPGVTHAMAPVFAVMPFNPNPQTPNAIEAVKRLRAVSPSLEAPSSAAATTRVSAEDLRLALDAVSSGSSLSTGPAVDHSRSDRPARGRVCTLARTTPAAARRAAATAAARAGVHAGEDDLPHALGSGAGEMVPRGGSSSPLPPRALSPSPRQGEAAAPTPPSSVACGGSSTTPPLQPASSPHGGDAAPLARPTSPPAGADVEVSPPPPTWSLAGQPASPRAAMGMAGDMAPPPPAVGTARPPRVEPARGGSTSTTTSPRAAAATRVSGTTAVAPIRRSSRHGVGIDGAMATDEDSMAKAMRRKAESNIDFLGNLPVYGFARFMVATSAFRG